MKSFINGKYFWLSTFSLHVLLLILLYIKFGFNFTNEADKYISIAKGINFQNISSQMQDRWAYSTFIFFLAACFKLGFSLQVIIFIQYLFCIIGYYCFYKLIQSQNIFSDTYSKITLFLTLNCPIILFWQLSLFSESFFISLNLICTYLIFSSQNNKQILIAFIFCALLLFCRPIGMLFLAALAYVWLKNKKIKYAILFSVAAYIFVFIAVLFFLPLHYQDAAIPVLQGSVIWGFPAYPDILLPNGRYTLAEIYSLLAQQKGLGIIFELFIKKSISFFTLTRPYYSVFHNVINAVHYVFMLGAGLAMFMNLRMKNEKKLIISFNTLLLISNVILVGLFCNEWSERYIVPLFPFFIMLFTFSLQKIKERLSLNL